MKTRGTLFVAALLVISIAVIGCGKLDQEEFEMWKNEHVAEVNQSNTEIKANLTKLEGKVDQNNKDTMEAISRAKDEAIAASQQGDADNIAAARQNTKEEIAKARADITKSINSQSKETLASAKAEDAKVQKEVMANSSALKALTAKVERILAAVSANSDDITELKADAASKPTLLLTVNFSSGQTGLSSKAKEMLDGIVGQIMENPEAEILVEGHADGTPVLRGGHRSNWDLSQSRANSVVKYLKGKGIDAERIRSVGKAHTDPVAPQNTSAGRAMNRRVEVILNPSGAM